MLQTRVYLDCNLIPGRFESNSYFILYCKSPTVFKQTDLPPAFGPDIKIILCLSLKKISKGTTSRFSFKKERNNRG